MKIGPSTNLGLSTALLLLVNTLIISAQSPAQLQALRAALAKKENGSEPTTTTEPPEPTTRDPRLTGDPRHDYIYDPNLPRELNGHNLSTYPFYTSIPDDITFKCDGRLDGYYASIPHHCQLFHLCVHSLRHDFLCANYTVFDQSQFICHFVNSVNCSNSETYYERNNELYVTTTTELPEYEDEYEEEPRTKRPARRRKGGRRRKARRRTTTTPPPAEEYYYDDYADEEEPLPLEEEIVEEEAPKPKRGRKTSTSAPTESPEAPAVKPNVQKARRPQLRPPKPLTQPPTAPPAEEDLHYEDPQDTVGVGAEEVGEDPPQASHPTVAIDERRRAPPGLLGEGQENRAPTKESRRPLRGSQTEERQEPPATSHSADLPAEAPARRRPAPVSSIQNAEDGAAPTQRRRQRVSPGTEDAVDANLPQSHRDPVETDEIPAPRPPRQRKLRPQSVQPNADATASNAPTQETLSVARSPFRGSSRAADDGSVADVVQEQRRQSLQNAAANVQPRRPLPESVDYEDGGAAETPPSRSSHAPRQNLRGPSRTVEPSPLADENHDIVDEPILDEEPRQPSRRISGSIPRRRQSREVSDATGGDPSQPFQGTADMDELRGSASRQSSTALLPDPASVIAGILSGIGPIPPPEPNPKNKTANETESTTEHPEPPSSDAFVVGSILSGIGAGPSGGPTRTPTLKSPTVSSRKANRPEDEAKEAPPTVSDTAVPSPVKTAQQSGAAENPAAQEGISSAKENNGRRVVKRRRKGKKPTTTTRTSPPEEEYDYVE